ncbi:MAG: hypothetical protein OXN96_13385 [Bryobacterales bacterium]|nr:hypothetical protein [Bryobacterales bacterium]
MHHITQENTLQLKSTGALALAVLALVLLASRAAEAQTTASQVKDDASLKAFVLGASAEIEAITDINEGARLRERLRTEGDWKSGSMFLVIFLPTGEPFIHGNDQTAESKNLLGVLDDDGLKVVQELLAAAARGGDFVRYNDGEPKTAYAVTYTSGITGRRFVLAGGYSQDVSHVPVAIPNLPKPAVTASQVKDRETLITFVEEAARVYREALSEGYSTLTGIRNAFRLEGGDWKSGSIYLWVVSGGGFILFHGTEQFREGRPTDLTRTDINGVRFAEELLGGARREGRKFLQYHYDDPTIVGDEDTGSPKLGYAVSFSVPNSQQKAVIGSGIYLRSSGAITSGCSDRNIAARAVRTQRDIQAFVECAEVYLDEHGTAEARRAFNEDERWKHGPTYVFVDGIAKSGTDAKTFVYPPDPSREGGVWGEAIDDFGNDLFYEIYRMTQAVDAGWTYYSFPNPATGKRSAKASYIIEIDWDGEPAVIGAGIYSRDWPGTCYADEVNAATLSAAPSAETLREFVRCAALVVEAGGYFAKREIERDPRWTDGENYLFVLDMLGNQVMSGQSVRVNGRALHEWGRGGPRGDQFGGRDMAQVGGTFGESYVYYRSYNSMTGAYQPKVGFVKRVVAQGVPLLVGAGYPVGPAAAGPSCADNYVTAAAVRTQSDLQAFVQCAAEYVQQHGEEEARRAFNEDLRWKSGSTYVFVDGLQPSGEDSLTHVFPPDPSREGSVWGTSIDGFGSDYFFELHRILSVVDEGWIYYAFNNPVTGQRQPKSSYVIEIDWNGDRAAIGAGIYSRDFPGTCDPSDVTAADLAANPGNQRLQEFVRCATMMVESSGYFAGPILSADPRWKSGPIFIFGINAESGVVEFSGNRASFATSGRIPEVLFDGRDMVEASALFGEVFWYYDVNNTATGDEESRVSFVKLVQAQGIPLLVGSGYKP